MIPGIRSLVLSTIAALCLPAAAISQTPPAPATPTGRWVAEHPSNGGIGSWWDFHPDGTLTLHFGAMVTTHVTHTADTVTMPSGTVGTPPVHVKFRVEGAVLHLISPSGDDRTFTRIGDPPSSTDPLLGKWKPDLPTHPSADANQAILDKATANGIYVFSADNTQSVRIPFGSREGTWNSEAHTFQFKNEPTVYSYQLSGDKLVLAQPPDGKQTDTYLRDPIF